MTDDIVVRFGLVLALVGILLVALVFVGEAVRPTPILSHNSGGPVPLPTGTSPAP